MRGRLISHIISMIDLHTQHHNPFKATAAILCDNRNLFIVIAILADLETTGLEEAFSILALGMESDLL